VKLKLFIFLKQLIAEKGQILQETCFVLLRHTRLYHVLSSFPETSCMKQMYAVPLRLPPFFRLKVHPHKTHYRRLLFDMVITEGHKILCSAQLWLPYQQKLHV